MMRAMNDFQRHLLSALYELGRGQTFAQTVSALQRRFGYLSQADASTITEAAMSAQANAVQMSLAPIGETLSSVFSQGGVTQLEFVIDATVKLETPGREPEYRTVRLSVDGSETPAQIYEQVNRTIDDWIAKYGAEGRTGSFTISAIF